jgi:vacuolar-type H+-ATPase subunit D/Vma8
MNKETDLAIALLRISNAVELLKEQVENLTKRVSFIEKVLVPPLPKNKFETEPLTTPLKKTLFI